MPDLKLKLEKIAINHSGDVGGGFGSAAAEWKLDINAGGQHFDWDKDGVHTNDTFTIGKVFEFKNWNPRHDLEIKSSGHEDDSWSPNDELPSDDKTINNFRDQSFEMNGTNSDFSYTLHWQLDVSPFV